MGQKSILEEFYFDCVGNQACREAHVDIIAFDEFKYNLKPQITCWTYVFLYIMYVVMYVHPMYIINKYIVKMLVMHYQ